MRTTAVLLSCLALAMVSAEPIVEGFPWPWGTKTTTTQPPFSSFERGVAEALGFQDASTCLSETGVSAHDLWTAAEDYMKGGIVKKAEALANFGKAIAAITTALAACTDVTTKGLQYKKLVQYVSDPRFYTWNNALTLALNTAEDHHELMSFASSWKSGDFQQAGFELTTAILDVLEDAEIPATNGTCAVQVAYGFAHGFASDVELKCFQDVEVEVPALVGGVLDVMSVAKAVAGLESIFHALEGVVPTFRQCMADKPKMLHLLDEFKDFHNGTGVAKMIGENIEHHAVDISLETASCVLAYKEHECQRMGEEVGKMMSKVIIGASTVVV